MPNAARTSRIAAAAVVAVALPFGLAGCGGGGIDQKSLVSTLKGSGDYDGLPDQVIDCLATVFIDHASTDDLRAYMDGDRPLDEVPMDDPEKTGADVADCVTD